MVREDKEGTMIRDQSQAQSGERQLFPVRRLLSLGASERHELPRVRFTPLMSALQANKIFLCSLVLTLISATAAHLLGGKFLSQALVSFSPIFAALIGFLWTPVPLEGVFAVPKCSDLFLGLLLLLPYFLVTQAEMRILLYWFPGMAAPEPSPPFEIDAAIWTLSALLIPVAEEFFFRGYYLGATLPLGRFWALFNTSILFSVLHGITGGVVGKFFLGLGLAALTLKSASLIPAILAHVFNNTLALGTLQFYADRQAPIALPPRFSFIAEALLLLTGACMIGLFCSLTVSRLPVSPFPRAPWRVGLKPLVHWSLIPVWGLLILSIFVP
jgi:membrane protease YdiL (CAAX protease family)